MLRMEFATFCAAFIQMPCQIVRGARRLTYRLLSWNPWQGVFLRLVERLQWSADSSAEETKPEVGVRMPRSMYWPSRQVKGRRLAMPLERNF